MSNIKDLTNLGSSKFCSGVPMGFQKCRESVHREAASRCYKLGASDVNRPLFAAESIQTMVRQR